MASRVVSRAALFRSLRTIPRQRYSIRYISTENDSKLEPKQVEIPIPPPPPREKGWLTRKVETSETWRYWFLKYMDLLGYNNPKQLAGRRSFRLYRDFCAHSPDKDGPFWREHCDLPPTLQTWFTVTTLHVWMLTVRARALPKPHGKLYVQFLLDHFFIDVEDRIRAVLQPPTTGPPRESYTTLTSFYVNPNAPAMTPDGKPIRRSQAPERLVIRQLKIFREQWMGITQSLDLSLVHSDSTLASTVWRNFLGARGAAGIAYPGDPSAPKFRRTVNLAGSDIENPEKMDLEKEAVRDDGSGVHDFSPNEVDKYVKYPERMLDIVAYIRRELKRLEGLSDEEFMEGPYSFDLYWGKLEADQGLRLAEKEVPPKKIPTILKERRKAKGALPS